MSSTLANDKDDEIVFCLTYTRTFMQGKSCTVFYDACNAGCSFSYSTIYIVYVCVFVQACLRFCVYELLHEFP
jgi:hypothetical protein